MIDYENMRAIVVKGLIDYLKCPVVRSNQNEEPPEYPYVSYTVTRLLSENNGTYGEYEDGSERKPFTQTWSITVLSDNNSECVELVSKAHEWLDRIGRLYLSDNNVIVQSIGGITNRDNVITTEYEYRNGFDVVFWLMDEITTDTVTDVIEVIDINGEEIKPIDYNEILEKRLSGEEVSE